MLRPKRALVFHLFCVGLAVSCARASVLFVDAQATGANNGQSWTDAFADLQSALAMARQNQAVTQIWVADGVYRPAGVGGNRQATFSLINGVAVLGGFAGHEASAADRNPRVNVTVLDGDLNGDDSDEPGGSSCCSSHTGGGCDDKACQTAVCAVDPFCCIESWDSRCAARTVCLCGDLCSTRCENSYHVVSAGGTVGIDSILDGFTIRGGAANDDEPADARGGGLHVGGGSPTIIECTFFDNEARVFGGAAYVAGPARFINCTFVGNSAESGGAAAVVTSEPVFTNGVFSGNRALDFGGALHVVTGRPRITNCSFSLNQAQVGGGMRSQDLSQPRVTNCILWANTDRFGSSATAQISNELSSLVLLNYSIVEGGTELFGGVGNNSANPLFVSDAGSDLIPGTPDDNLRLSSGSPAIDAGSNSAVPRDVADLDGDGNRTEPTPVDRADVTRFVDDPRRPNSGEGEAPIVDMGAYEVTGDCNNNGALDEDDVLNQTSADCNGNRIPDECEIHEDSTAPGGPYYCMFDCDADCNTNGRIDDCEPDGDRDGLINACDQCPNTPPGVPIDEFGCSLPGGCCFNVGGGACLDSLQDVACAAIGGTFLGYGLSCASDLDEDGVRGCADACPDDPNKSHPGFCGCGMPDDDIDGDGVVGCLDRCPNDNPDDSDGDGVCNSLDPCPLDPVGDSDGDGVCDNDDPCPSDNPDDSDGDGVCNSKDPCPNDPDKTNPGVCGCGVPEVDTDGDGVFDCLDECPGTPFNVPVDEVGCPAIGACCFPIGVCANDTQGSVCRLVGGVYQGNGTICADGCAPLGDLDLDGDVDLDDLALMLECVSGPEREVDEECVLGDFDRNGVIDLRDVAAFQNAYTGAG